MKRWTKASVYRTPFAQSFVIKTVVQYVVVEREKCGLDICKLNFSGLQPGCYVQILEVNYITHSHVNLLINIMELFTLSQY